MKKSIKILAGAAGSAVLLVLVPSVIIVSISKGSETKAENETSGGSTDTGTNTDGSSGGSTDTGTNTDGTSGGSTDTGTNTNGTSGGSTDTGTNEPFIPSPPPQVPDPKPGKNNITVIPGAKSNELAPLVETKILEGKKYQLTNYPSNNNVKNNIPSDWLKQFSSTKKAISEIIKTFEVKSLTTGAESSNDLLSKNVFIQPFDREGVLRVVVTRASGNSLKSQSNTILMDLGGFKSNGPSTYISEAAYANTFEGVPESNLLRKDSTGHTYFHGAADFQSHSSDEYKQIVANGDKQIVLYGDPYYLNPFAKYGKEEFAYLSNPKYDGVSLDFNRVKWSLAAAQSYNGFPDIGLPSESQGKITFNESILRSATIPDNVKRIISIMDENDWDHIFPSREEAYSYRAFLTSAAKYPRFAAEYNINADWVLKLKAKGFNVTLGDVVKMELSTMIAHFAQETGMHSDQGGEPIQTDEFVRSGAVKPANPNSTIPNEQWRQGLFHVKEAGIGATGGDYREAGSYNANGLGFPADSRSRFFGRGAKQLSYNYNYGSASRSFYGPELSQILLRNPQLVDKKGNLPIATAFNFYMLPDGGKPSIHETTSGLWQQTNASVKVAGLRNGFGVTTLIINGGVEGGAKSVEAERTQSINRRIYFWHASHYFGINEMMFGHKRTPETNPGTSATPSRLDAYFNEVGLKEDGSSDWIFQNNVVNMKQFGDIQPPAVKEMIKEGFTPILKYYNIEYFSLGEGVDPHYKITTPTYALNLFNVFVPGDYYRIQKSFWGGVTTFKTNGELSLGDGGVGMSDYYASLGVEYTPLGNDFKWKEKITPPAEPKPVPPTQKELDNIKNLWYNPVP